jgi:hypothetical protein
VLDRCIYPPDLHLSVAVRKAIDYMHNEFDYEVEWPWRDDE